VLGAAFRHRINRSENYIVLDLQLKKKKNFKKPAVSRWLSKLSVLWDRALPPPPPGDAAFTAAALSALSPGPPPSTPRCAAQRHSRLRLTSGRLCWSPALRRPASMSAPRSSRPPWAPLSYYSHSAGCPRGCRTSKRTFNAVSPTHSVSLSPLSILPPSPPASPPLCVCLIALSAERSARRGLSFT